MHELSINDKDVVGATKLYNAVAYDRFKQVKALLAQGADPNIPENNGITPLMNAASRENLAMIKLLLEYGAKADLKDNFGDDAIIYAEKQNCHIAAEYLRSLK
jgi:ankyrin repeat protein